VPNKYKIQKKFAGYHDPAAITNILQQTAKKFSMIAQVIDVGKDFGSGNNKTTYEGKPLLALKISSNATINQNIPKILIVSCHHAREITTPELALFIIDKLTSLYGSDKTITDIVNKHEIYVSPFWNPDGLDYVWIKNNMWRKNRRPVAGGHYGVDQNRNYPQGWDGKCHGDDDPSSEVYRGPYPASENETQIMINFSRQKNFAKVLDFHSYGRQVLNGYTCIPMPANMKSFIDNEGIALSKFASYTTRVPTDDGEHQEYSLKEQTSYSYLVETCEDFQPSYSVAEQESARVWPLVLQFLLRPVSVTGSVVGDQLVPVEAYIEVDEAKWLAGETRKSDATFGRFSLYLPDGKFTLRFKAAGYKDTVQPVTVVKGTQVILDIHMSK